MKVREFLAKIDTKIKALNIDDWISSKFLYNEVKSIVSDFLKKDNSNSRLLYKNNTSFTELEGIPMIKVSVTDCDLGDVFNCSYLMRTKEPLPPIYTSKFGPIINQVASINFGTIYQNAFTPRQWKAIQQREFQDKSLRYFFFLGNHLYIPILKASEISPEEIRLSAMFKDRFQVDKYRQLVGTCEGCKKDNPCKRLLDYEIVIPDYLELDIEDKLVLDLANVYLKVISDSNPDLNNTDKNNQRNIQNRKLTDS